MPRHTEETSTIRPSDGHMMRPRIVQDMQRYRVTAQVKKYHEVQIDSIARCRNIRYLVIGFGALLDLPNGLSDVGRLSMPYTEAARAIMHNAHFESRDMCRNALQVSLRRELLSALSFDHCSTRLTSKRTFAAKFRYQSI
ncbi:hypothetical protein PV11_08963 [Exophiala sideris]|uniref:Uncharacterized protein n=1 Tax=Exophiala sideris TaxID=1016849 RepID=A0A0D1WPX7_9EURO|nr:hypothetical protein PV11_08963 [Exophiala sideris]